MFFYVISRLIIEVAFIVEVALADIKTDKVIVDSYFKVVQILVSILAISTTNFPSITNTNYPSITKTTYFIPAMVILNNPSITNTAYSAYALLVLVILNPSSSVNRAIPYPCVLINRAIP